MGGAMESIDRCLSTFLSLQNFQQRYGYKNASLDAKEKAKLQAEILELVFAHGEYWLAKGELLRKR
jgi:hypothetical protein